MATVPKRRRTIVPAQIPRPRHRGDPLTGGARAGGVGNALYPPLTVLDSVTPTMAAFREGTFGPLLPITTFTDDNSDEAVRLAPRPPRGGVHGIAQPLLPLIDDLCVGTILVNESTNFWEQHPPFGGTGGTRTGWGRIRDEYTLHDMTDLRTAVVKAR